MIFLDAGSHRSPRSGVPPPNGGGRSGDDADPLRLRALLALGDLELDALAVVQRL